MERPQSNERANRDGSPRIRRPLSLTLSPLRGARANGRKDPRANGKGSAPRPAKRGEADGRKAGGRGAAALQLEAEARQL